MVLLRKSNPQTRDLQTAVEHGVIKGTMRSKLKYVTLLFYSVAVLSLWLGVESYRGSFDVGHGGIPLMAVMFSIPATIVAVVILILSKFMLKKYEKYQDYIDSETKKSMKLYYQSILINVAVNFVSALVLLK